jgi:hypothetical protein
MAPKQALIGIWYLVFVPVPCSLFPVPIPIFIRFLIAKQTTQQHNKKNKEQVLQERRTYANGILGLPACKLCHFA